MRILTSLVLLGIYSKLHFFSIRIFYFSLQSINPLIAKKMTEDRGREYINARRVAKEYEAVTRGLNKNLPSVPPQNNPDEAQQVNILSSGSLVL